MQYISAVTPSSTALLDDNVDPTVERHMSLPLCSVDTNYGNKETPAEDSTREKASSTVSNCDISLLVSSHHRKEEYDEDDDYMFDDVVDDEDDYHFDYGKIRLLETLLFAAAAGENTTMIQVTS